MGLGGLKAEILPTVQTIPTLELALWSKVCHNHFSSSGCHSVAFAVEHMIEAELYEIRKQSKPLNPAVRQ